MSAKPFLSDRAYKALYEAGVFDDDPNDVARVVIDLQAGSIAKVYVQRYIDESFIDVVMSGGVELVERKS